MYYSNRADLKIYCDSHRTIRAVVVLEMKVIIAIIDHHSLVISSCCCCCCLDSSYSEFLYTYRGQHCFDVRGGRLLSRLSFSSARLTSSAWWLSNSSVPSNTLVVKTGVYIVLRYYIDWASVECLTEHTSLILTLVKNVCWWEGLFFYYPSTKIRLFLLVLCIQFTRLTNDEVCWRFN